MSKVTDAQGREYYSAYNRDIANLLLLSKENGAHSIKIVQDDTVIEVVWEDDNA